MGFAIQAAKSAPSWGDVPIGAAVFSPSGQLLSAAANQRERDHDPLAHAEVLAIQQAAKVLGTWRLDGCTLAVTLEPCPMCAGAIGQARISKLIFGAFDPKAGAVASLFDLLRDPRLPNRVEVISGVRAAECEQLLQDFFAKLR